MFQVGAQTETELKEKKLRVEDALNATKVINNYSYFLSLALNKFFIPQMKNFRLEWESFCR